MFFNNIIFITSQAHDWWQDDGGVHCPSNPCSYSQQRFIVMTNTLTNGIKKAWIMYCLTWTTPQSVEKKSTSRKVKDLKLVRRLAVNKIISRQWRCGRKWLKFCYKNIWRWRSSNKRWVYNVRGQIMLNLFFPATKSNFSHTMNL